MSAVPRSQRTRNKPSTADPPDPEQDNVANNPSSPAPPPAESKPTHTTQPSLTNAEAMDILMQLSNGADQTRSTVPPLNGGANAATKPSTSQVRPEVLRAASDRSSSLSELDDLEDQDEPPEEPQDPPSSDDDDEEDDTEAETERLHISPEKSRMLAAGGARSHLGRQSSRQSEILSDIEDVDSADEAGLSIQPLGADTTKGKNITSAEAASRKRKRTSSLVEPLRNRPSSGRMDQPEVGDGDVIMQTDDVVHDDELSEAAEEGELADREVDEEALKSPTLAASKARNDELDSSDRELSEPPDEAKTPPEVEPDEGGAPEEVDAGADVEADVDAEAEPDVEEDEAEAAAKSEDELAKKMTAMDALKPIENLFAIFRDKLYDERLAALSAQLDLLNHPDCRHPEFLAMRHAVDLRRDEKVELEQVSLRYKLQVQERRIVADRAQIHSQYQQAVREMREEHMAALNKRFSRVQQDRRKFNTPQTSYGYKFDPTRVEQIASQRSYNKEVALLSGLAKYVGFPSGPSIPTPRPQQVEEDLRKMKIRPAAPAYVPPIANTRVDENVNDESWLERNAWANPNHPASQHVRYNGVFTTPASQRRTVEVQYGPIGSGSTIPFASDPPSSSMAPRATQGESQALVEQSSPFEQLKRRNIDAQHKNDIVARDTAAAINGGLGITTADERVAHAGSAREQQDHGPPLHQFPTPGMTSGETFNRERHDYARSPLPRASQMINGTGSSPAPPAERIGVR